MKIAFIDQSFHWPPRGGSWVDLRETAIRIRKAGDDVRIFTTGLTRWHVPAGRILEDPGVPVTVIPMKFRQFNFRTAPRMIFEAVSAWNPDTVVVGNTFFLAPFILKRLMDGPRLFLRVYAHEMVCLNYMGMSRGDPFKIDRNNPTGRLCGTSLPVSPLKCWRCALRRMLPTLIGPRLNEVAFEYFSSLGFLPWYHQYVRAALTGLSGILVYNPFIRDLFLPFNVPVHIVPAGVDTARFTPRGHSTGSIPRILMPGRADDPRKGFGIFAQALERLREHGIRFKALVTDPRSDFSHPLIESTGWIDSDQLPDLYRSVDIVVSPSIWPEPFGIIPLEAMACGIPVVVSESGGMKYTVLDGEQGFVFPVGDPETLATHLERLVNDPDLRRTLGANGRDRAVRLFNWDRIVDSISRPVLTGETDSSLSWLDWPENVGKRWD